MKALRRIRRRYARVHLVRTDWERLFILCPRARLTDEALLAAGFTRRGRVSRVRLRDGRTSLMAVWMRTNGFSHETFTMRIEVTGHER